MQIDDSRSRAAASPAQVLDRGAIGLRLPLVRDLSAAHRALVMAAGEAQRQRAGAVFCTEKRDQDWAYYLFEGTLAVTGNDSVVRELEAAGSGMLECFHAPGQGCARARAKSEATIFRIPVGILGRYINLTRVAAIALPDVFELGSDDNADGLELALSIGVLSRLAPHDIQRLLQRVEEVPVRAGEVILQQGGGAHACYIVKTGVAEVDMERHGGAQYRVAMKGPGEFFGEEALLAGAPRGATVRMRTDGLLLRIDEEDFRRLIAPSYVRPVHRARADVLVAEGAIWLDMREPVEFQHGSMPEAINLPEAILRLRCTSLDSRQRYIVCSGEPGCSALGNFMLSAAGLDAFYLDESIGKLEATSRIPFATELESELNDLTHEVLKPDEDLEPRAPPADVASPVSDDTYQIGLEDVRAAERQRYHRRLRKTIARLITEVDTRVRAAVQEVEVSYLTELENKHRQVLELKRKVALQQRAIWKLQQAAAAVPAKRWSPEVSPDSI